MKVFQLNDCDWYAGEDLESCIKFGMELTGLERDDILDEKCHELTEQEMDTLLIGDERGEHTDGIEDHHTFREWLTILEERNEINHTEFPCFFASTEY